MPKGDTPAPGAAASFLLEEFAPYRIVVLGDAISRRMGRAYADENLTIPEWRVLAVVGQAERVAARDVVARTPMDKMRVSRAVTSLEEKGFVARETDPDDRRVFSLSLSAEGRTVFERVAALALAIEKEILSVLSPEERDVFETAMAKLTACAGGDG
ncbi:MAG: MarR family transcriptional regulator [Pseudomonadota bacterium]